MRLIDADALKEQFEELHLHPDLIELLDNAPTVYKRSQGKWVFHNESCRYGCNLCGNLNNILSNFCPNCGAKMEQKCRKAVRNEKITSTYMG